MTTNTHKYPYIVQMSKACMPSSCWGRYVNVAVLRVNPFVLAAHGYDAPKMISERAIGVEEIVRYWPRCHDGSTERSASGRALAAARALAAQLNAEWREKNGLIP